MSASWHTERQRPGFHLWFRSPIAGCVFFQVSPPPSPPVTDVAVLSVYFTRYSWLRRGTVTGVFCCGCPRCWNGQRLVLEKHNTVALTSSCEEQVTWLRCLHAIGCLVLQTKPPKDVVWCRKGKKEWSSCNVHAILVKLHLHSLARLDYGCSTRMDVSQLHCRVPPPGMMCCFTAFIVVRVRILPHLILPLQS